MPSRASVDSSIQAALLHPWTADLGGSAPTAAVVDAVLERALTPAS